jgi:cytochrome c2
MKPILLAAVLLAATSSAEPTTTIVERGESAFRKNGCYGCHIIQKFGTPIGPNLSQVGRRYQPEYLARWLRDPSQQRPSAHMPALELTEDDVQALAAYLGSLR